MDKIFEMYERIISSVDMRYIRDLESKISWNARLIGIRGARGVGKTTLMLQHIKKNFPTTLSKVLYVSLDNFWFATNTLYDLADYFVKRGGTHLFLDEVHQYPNWSIEIKNLYDTFPSLHIVFTGSSLLEILNARIDLSRRALMYDLPGLSLREYGAITDVIKYPSIDVEEFFLNYEEHARNIANHISIFPLFERYLKSGYYPYFLEGEEDYFQRLHETVMMTLSVELPILRKMESSFVPKVRTLLAVISESAPFIPNISKLAERIGLNRQTLISYLRFLEDAKLIRLLYKHSHGIGQLQKPEKIYIDNTNLIYLLRFNRINIGNLRETFVASQLSVVGDINYTEHGDVLLNNTFTIEIGGKHKTRKQIINIPNSYIAADNIEFAVGDKIPIWLFGFLY